MVGLLLQSARGRPVKGLSLPGDHNVKPDSAHPAAPAPTFTYASMHACMSAASSETIYGSPKYFCPCQYSTS